MKDDNGRMARKRQSEFAGECPNLPSKIRYLFSPPSF